MKILDGFKKIMEFFVVIVMMLMVAVIFLATVGRYTGIYSIPWSEEFARYCMVVMVYFAAMLAAAKGAHFVVEVVPMLFPKSIVNIITIFDIVVVDLFSVFTAYTGYVKCAKLLAQGKVTPMLYLPQGVLYAVIPVGLILMAIYYTVYNIQKIKEKEEK